MMYPRGFSVLHLAVLHLDHTSIVVVPAMQPECLFDCLHSFHLNVFFLQESANEGFSGISPLLGGLLSLLVRYWGGLSLAVRYWFIFIFKSLLLGSSYLQESGIVFFFFFIY